MLGVIVLDATKSTRLVAFEADASSFNKGITIQAMGGVVISETVTTKNSVLLLNGGTGSLKITPRQVLSTSDQLLTVITDDIEISSSAQVNTGTARIEMTTYTPNATIALGSAVGSYHVEDSELGQFVTQQGLYIGDSHSGDIVAGGLRDSSTDTFSLLTLKATRAESVVSFESSSSSFNKGITVQANGGIVLSESVATRGSESLLQSGTSILTIASTMTLQSTANLLTVTASDIDIHTDGAVATPNSQFVARPFETSKLGLGEDIGGFELDADELSGVSGSGVIFDGSVYGINITVRAIPATSSDLIVGALTILATRDDSVLTFETGGSTFNVLDAIADNGVAVHSDLASATGGLYIDADADDSSTADSFNDIEFGASVTVQANTVLTLEATTGILQTNGPLTLNGGVGVLLLDNVQPDATSMNADTVINADIHTNGVGILTVTATKTLRSGGSLMLTASDLDLSGEIHVDSAVTYSPAPLQSIGVGTAAGDVTIDQSEMQRIQSSGLVLGGTVSGNIVVSNVTKSDSRTIEGVISLIAQRDDASIVFSVTASTFYGLAALADNGVQVQVDLTATDAYMMLDGDADDSSSSDGLNLLSIDGARTLQSGTSMTLDSTSGGIHRSTGTVQLLGGDSVNLMDSFVSSSEGHLLIINADADSDGVGGLVVAERLDTNNGALLISASDVDFGASGEITTGTATLSTHVSHNGVTLGLGETTKDLSLSVTELSSITSNGLNFGNTLNGIAVLDNVLATATATIDGIISIFATGQARQALFEGSMSTFSSLSVQADNGITISTGVNTLTGDLLIDADADNNSLGDRKDRLIIGANTLLQANGSLVLDSTSGGIIPGGDLSLLANGGVVLNDNLHYESGQSGNIVVDADTQGDGVGSLIVRSGVSIDSSNSPVRIKAAGLLLDGSINAGTSLIELEATKPNQTMNVGGATTNWSLSDTELGRLTAHSGLTVGSSVSGTIIVTNVSDSNSATIGTLTLKATGVNQEINFTSAPSEFNKGIVVQASGMVTIAQAVTTKQSSTLLSAGTGTVSVAAGVVLSTSHQHLTVRADDFEVDSSAQINTGNASCVVVTQSALSMALGDPGTGLHLSASELQSIVAGGLTIGSAGVNTGIVVSGVTATATDSVPNVMTLLAVVDNSQISFESVGSTFSALAAQADNGVVVNKPVTTTSAQLYLDGDAEDDAAEDDFNSIGFSADSVATSKQLLTLEATIGQLERAGSLTLQAGAGIMILNSLVSTVAGEALVMNADYEGAGQGTLTVVSSRLIDSNQGQLLLTAADLDLQGSVSTGSASCAVHVSVAGATMALGEFENEFNLSGDELQRISAEGLLFGSARNGDITAASITAAQSSNIISIATITATRDDATVHFKSTGSTFNTVAVLADNGVQLEASLSTANGDLLLDGDAENSSSSDSVNTIALDGELTLSATSTLILGSTIELTGVGTAVLESKNNNIVMTESLSNNNSGRSIMVIAKQGVLDLQAGTTFSTGNAPLTIQTSDLQFNGSVDAGSAAVTLEPSLDNQIVGLGGVTDAQYTLGGDALTRVSCTGLSVGSSVSGSLYVDSVTVQQSNNIAGVLTLLATRDATEIHFTGAPSVFGGVSALADDGVDVFVNISSTSGAILLDGDVDTHDEGTARDHVSFVADLTLTAETDISLLAASGGIKVAGALTLLAKGSIYIDNEFRGPFGSHEVVITPDSDSDGVGELDIAATACSHYTDCGTCAASRLCGWCGHEPGTVGVGLLSMSGAVGTEVTGLGTSFISQINAGDLISAEGQSRVVTQVISDTELRIDSMFVRTLSGSVSVYEPELDHMVGSPATTLFSEQVRSGYSILVGEELYEVASVQSNTRMTLSSPAITNTTGQQWSIYNADGSGTASGSAGSDVITGSWPPSATKFTTELSVGDLIKILDVDHTVASIQSDQQLTIEQALSSDAVDVSYKVAGQQGIGALMTVEGSTTVVGATGVASAFGQELRSGDLVQMMGQTKMVQEVIDDQLLRVSDFFTTSAYQQTFTSSAVHEAAFSVARNATGTVTSSGNVLLGQGTTFGADLNVGYAVLVMVGTEYEQREVLKIVSDTELEMSSTFSADVVSGTGMFYATCPTTAASAEMDSTTEGKSVAFNSASKAPATCFSSGRCIPRSARNTDWEMQGTGQIAGVNPLSALVAGEGTSFLSELQTGSVIAVAVEGYQESRRVVSVASNDQCTVDSPFSFTITPSSASAFIIRQKAASGTVSQAAGNQTVIGEGTNFGRDLAVGWIVAVGEEKRIVTEITSDTQISINAPWEQSGVAHSAYSFEACASGFGKTYTIDTCELEPGCCGYQLIGSAGSNQFAYYKITPPNDAQHLRLSLTSDYNQLDMFIRAVDPPDTVNYELHADGSNGMWEVAVPSHQLQCSNSTCEALVVGIKASSMQQGTTIAYQLNAFFEFDFTSFGCSSSGASTLPSKCDDLGLLQLGNTTVVYDQQDNLNPVLQLTGASSSIGAAWYKEPVHLEAGFETSFSFRLVGCGSDSCSEGFSFIIYGGGDPHDNLIGCTGSGLGFGSTASCTDGITTSLAIEFDTWHNSDLHDLNGRGVGNTLHNATVETTSQYNHIAIFSEGESPNTVDHKHQLAGTVAVPDFSDGAVHKARVVYVAASEGSLGRIFVYVDDVSSFVLTTAITLARTATCPVQALSNSKRCVLDSFGNARVGFTASGATESPENQAQQIHDWTFCNQPNCGR
jgi:hypothetical protein